MNITHLSRRRSKRRRWYAARLMASDRCSVISHTNRILFCYFPSSSGLEGVLKEQKILKKKIILLSFQWLFSNFLLPPSFLFSTLPPKLTSLLSLSNTNHVEIKIKTNKSHELPCALKRDLLEAYESADIEWRRVSWISSIAPYLFINLWKTKYTSIDPRVSLWARLSARACVRVFVCVRDCRRLSLLITL